MPDSLWKPHVTVAALIAENDQFLVVREKVDNNTVYNQPAGHLDEGESLIDAVIRETLEETRYQFSPTGLVGIYRYCVDSSPYVTYLRFCFSGNVCGCLDGELDQDIIAAEWMTIDQLKAVQESHRSPMVLQCINDFLQNQPYPLDVISTVYA